MATSSSLTPTDGRPRFTTPTPWDAQAGLWIVTILSIIYAFTTIPIRHVIRRKFALADGLLYVGFTLALLSYVFMFLGLEAGAGIAPDHLSEHSYRVASKRVFISLVFLLLAGGCAACSQLSLLEELVPGTEEKCACWLAVLVCSCSAVVSAIAVSAGCTSTNMLNTGDNGSCPDPVARWSAALALMILINAVPALIPAYLFRTLRTRCKRRAGLYIAFAFPLFTVALAALAIHLFIDATHHGNDGTGLVGFLCCLECLLGWELISPTIPLGRPMALRFTTHGTIILGEGYGSGLGSGVRGTFPAANSHSSRTRNGGEPGKRRACHRPFIDDEIELRPDLFMHSSIIRHETSDEVLDEYLLDQEPTSVHDSAMQAQFRHQQQQVSAGEGIRRTVRTQVESFRAEDLIGHS